MGIFDKQVKRRPPKGNDGNLELDDLNDLREEMPEVDSTLDKLALALESPMTQGGCGCFG